MKKLKYSGIIILLAIALTVQSCNKTDVVSQVNSPVVTLTPSQKSGVAGDEIQIDLVTTATNNIQRIQMTEQYNGGSTKTLVDSTITASTTYIDRNFSYDIPASASANQTSVLSFTVTDVKGNTTTKSVTISITGSQPNISLNTAKTALSAGENAQVNVLITSPVANIGHLVILQSINAQQGTTVKDTTFTNQSTVTYVYNYTAPSTFTASDKVALVFTVTDNNNVSRTKSLVFNGK
jgi:hypothetical protein